MTEPGTAGSGWDARRAATLTALLVLAGAAAWLLYQTGAAWAALVAGVVVATAVRPAIDRLCCLGPPRWVAALIVFAALAGGALAVLLLAVPVVTEQLARVVRMLPRYYADARAWLHDSPSRVARQIAYQLPASSNALSPRAPEASAMLGDWLKSLSALPSMAFGLLAVAVIGFYWSIERAVILRALSLAVPVARRDDARAFFDAAEERVGRYLRAQVVLCTAMGLLALIAYLALRLPHALLLGVFAAIAELIPFIGPAIGAAPALLVALSLGPARAGWTLLAFSLIQLAESYVLAPKILGRSVGVSAFTLLFSMAAFTALFGFAGTLLALPAAALIPLLSERLFGRTRVVVPHDDDRRDACGALRYEAALLALSARHLVLHGAVPPRSVLAEVAEEVEAVAAGIADSLDVEDTPAETAGAAAP